MLFTTGGVGCEPDVTAGGTDVDDVDICVDTETGVCGWFGGVCGGACCGP